MNKLSGIKTRYKKNPKWYYGFSIAASWAGAGSLMNSITITETYGLVPSIIWGLGNSAACIIFGIVITMVPQVRDLMKIRLMKWFLGILALFQIWINTTGINEVFDDITQFSYTGKIIAYAIMIGFTLALLRSGMIKNVLSDSITWYLAYGLIALTTIVALILAKGEFNAISLGLEWENVSVGIKKGLLLLPGPFTFPYFYKILDYNEQNEDKVNKANVRESFILGGTMFGIYMIFTYVLAFTQFVFPLNILKAVFIMIIAASSISTFIYSEYIVFGKKVGLVFNVAAIVGWALVVNLGVLGVWSLMATIRVYVVIGMLIYIAAKSLYERRRQSDGSIEKNQ